jgi:hypothetical protein
LVEEEQEETQEIIEEVDEEEDICYNNYNSVEPPYLAPLSEEVAKKTFTLILDLDETLIHFF